MPHRVALLLVLAACETRVNGPGPKDEDTAAAFGVESVAPTSGPAAGGTSVSIRGAGFTEGTTARVGDAACASLALVSAAEIVCVTPPGAPGATTIVVTEGGDTATAAFAYLDGDDTGDTGADTGDTGADTGDTSDPGDTGDTSDPGDTGADTGDTSDPGDTGDTSDPGDTGDTGATVLVPLDYCHLQYPCGQELAPGVASEAVYGWIYQGGVTEGAGVGVGITVEVGVGADGSDPAAGGWTWSPMVYNLDKDGLSTGDLANDEWRGTFTAPAEAGAYDYCVRASADGGASWTYCDGGGEACPGSGSDDGYTPADAGQLTVR